MKATGLDVDGAGLRVVTLDGAAHAARVATAAEAPRADLAGLPRPALAEEVVAGIGARALFLREVSLPFVQESQIPEVLPFEVEAFLPCPAEEISLAWLPMEPARAPDAEGNGSRGTVLAVAVRKDRLRDILASLGEGGVDPVSLSADLFALPEAWPDAGTEEPAVLADLDDARTAVLGWHAGKVRFARLLPPAEEGEAGVRDVAADIVRTLLAVDWQGRVKDLRVSGRRAEEPGFADALSKALSVPVRVWQGPPFEGTPLAPRFAVAYGLARRGLGSRACDVELRTGAFRSRNRWERLLGPFLALAACSVAALGLVAWGAWTRFRDARAEYREIAGWQSEALAAAFPESADIPPEEVLPFLRQKQAEFTSGPLGAGREGGRFFSAWDLFLEFIRCVPKGMPVARLDDVIVNQREVTIRGMTRDGAGKTGADWAWELERACRGSKWFSVARPVEVKPPESGSTPFELRLAVREGMARE